MSPTIVLCIVCLLCSSVWPAVSGGFFDGMNIGLTIPAMSIKVPAPGMPKIKVNADIKMPPKQSLKSMLPKFKYNIPTFVDDYHPMMMEYAASSSDQQQAMTPYQPNKRPQMGRNPKSQFRAPKNQFRALAGDLEPHGAPSNDQRLKRRPNSPPSHQTSGRPNYRPSNGYHQTGANDYRGNGPQQYGNFHSPASNSANQQPTGPLTSESRFRENPANFVQRNRLSAQHPGQGFGLEKRPAATRN